MTIWLNDPALLMRYRQHPERWDDLACCDGQDAEGRWYDEHALMRYRVLIALQYDHQAADLALVRFLMQHEVVRHEREPFQGILPALMLATYLLATYRNVTHVWNFYAAKMANFDTYCGYSSVVLVSAGIEQTLAYIRATPHPQQSAVQQLLIHAHGCPWTDADLTQWWDQQHATFPPTEEAETPETMMNRAITIQNADAARYWMVQWRAQTPATPSTCYHLVHCYAALGDWETAIAMQREKLTIDSDYARFTNLRTLADLYRCAGNLDMAWQTVQQAQIVADATTGWRQSGTARMLLMAGLAIAKDAASDAALVTAIFRWALDLLRQGCAVSLTLLRLAEEIAIRCADADAVRWLQRRADQERQRIQHP
jgi:tetratricopeptide (TPR) repeat protein